jgi:dTDP-4-dehydrorhamnose reductase
MTMRILILGGDGMIGHQCLKHLRQAHDVYATVHKPLATYAALGLLGPDRTLDNIDVRSMDRVAEAMAEVRPAAVLNATGIVKQRPQAKEATACIEINAMFPHRLATLCRAAGARLIQLSTDCVFSGRKGLYEETDPTDAEDLYGKTKAMGELKEAHCVTLRTSSLGLELGRRQGLIEWFLAQRGPIKGFRRAIYTGLTGLELSRVIERVLTSHTTLSGLYQVAAAPINKYDLLKRLAAALGRTDITISPDDDFVCDRSLCGRKFEKETGYQAPSWDSMLEELANLITERKAAS